MRVSVRYRLLAVIGVILFLMGISATFVITEFKLSNNLIEENYLQGQVNVKTLGDAITAAEQVRQRLLLLVNTSSPEEQERQQQKINDAAEQVDALVEAYAPSTAGGQALIEDFDAAWNAYLSAADKVARLAMGGQREEAFLAFEGQADHELQYALDHLRLAQDVEDNLARNRFLLAERRYLQARNGAMAMTVVILSVGLWLAYLLAKTVAEPVEAMARTAQKLAAGDLSQTLPVKAYRQDEIGVLVDAFNRMADRIRGLVGSLEERVAARTRRLETIAALSERLNAILDVDRLLDEMVHRLKEEFDYYHVHVYLLDETGKNLVVAAGVGDAGAVMKASGYHIALDAPTSLVARAARSGRVVRADNVRETPDWLPNPLLPDTHAEMAVPIVLAEDGTVVGVLDVQHDQTGVLDETDATLLRTLANQVAVAIRNARHFASVQAQLDEARATQEKYTTQAWQKVQVERRGVVYQRTRPGAPRLSRTLSQKIERDILQTGKPARLPINRHSGNADLKNPALAAPIQIQNQPIGSIQLIETEQEHPWTDDDLALIEAVAEQIAQTAETIRLFDEIHRRASREQTIREITDRLRAAPTLEALLETAARELGMRLQIPHTVLEIGIAPNGAEDEQP
ncbi:MAG: GAF domain-containing protein [Caldilineae bacterium]|nr:MAG: GAF domain-containing protein [Caldilineae bacterium]